MEKSKYEIFRFITPALITLALAILGAMYTDLNKIKDTVIGLQVDMASVQAHLDGLKTRGR